MAKKLDWQNNSVGHSAQKIYLKTDGSPVAELLATIDPDARSYIDAVDRSAATTLEYTVETVGTKEGVVETKLSDPVLIQVKPASPWRTTNELKLLTDTGEFRGHFSGFGAPSGHSLFLDMLNNYQETKASFYTYGADQLIGEVDLTEYLSKLKQLIIDYPTGINANTLMWDTRLYKSSDVSKMTPQFQTLFEAIASHFGVWTGYSDVTLQFEGQGGRLASGEFYMLGVLRLHVTMRTLREGESTQYLDIFVESVVTPSDDLTLYSRGRNTTDWGNLLKTAEELKGTSEEVLLKDNGDTSTIVLKELGYITRR